MPDRAHEIIVPDVVRTGVWPDGDWLCIRAEVEDGFEIGTWLRAPDGRVSHLVPYRVGMFKKGVI